MSDHVIGIVSLVIGIVSLIFSFFTFLQARFISKQTDKQTQDFRDNANGQLEKIILLIKKLVKKEEKTSQRVNSVLDELNHDESHEGKQTFDDAYHQDNHDSLNSTADAIIRQKNLQNPKLKKEELHNSSSEKVELLRDNKSNEGDKHGN